MHLEERSGLGGDVDSGVRSTLGGRGSDAHLTRVHLEDTTARSAPGGYRGQAGLTGTEDTAGGEHRLVKPGRYSWSGGYGVHAAAEDREHRLVKPGRGFGLGEHRILSTVSLNRDEGMSAEDATWENQHRL